MIDKASCANRLLHALTASDFILLAPHLTRVELEHRHLLAEANQTIEQIYFLEDGIASVVTVPTDTRPTEVGIFGREGFSGTAILLGTDRSPHRTFMQVDGTAALRIAAERLRMVAEKSDTLRAVLLRYVQTFLIQTASSAVANAQSRVEARLARWLLMCHDRVDGDEIVLTHEFMGMMIAAERTRVTLTLHVLEGGGMIQSKRGRVIVVDRERLEDVAGESYGQPEAEYRRLIGPLGRSPSLGA